MSCLLTTYCYRHRDVRVQRRCSVVLHYYVRHHTGAGWEPRRPMSCGVGGGFPRVRHAQHHGYGTEKQRDECTDQQTGQQTADSNTGLHTTDSRQQHRPTHNRQQTALSATVSEARVAVARHLAAVFPGGTPRLQPGYPVNHFHSVASCGHHPTRCYVH